MYASCTYVSPILSAFLATTHSSVDNMGTIPPQRRLTCDIRHPTTRKKQSIPYNISGKVFRYSFYFRNRNEKCLITFFAANAVKKPQTPHLYKEPQIYILDRENSNLWSSRTELSNRILRGIPIKYQNQELLHSTFSLYSGRAFLVQLEGMTLVRIFSLHGNLRTFLFIFYRTPSPPKYHRPGSLVLPASSGEIISYLWSKSFFSSSKGDCPVFGLNQKQVYKTRSSLLKVRSQYMRGELRSRAARCGIA